MRGDRRRQAAPALWSLALGCSFLLTKHISQLFRDIKGGKKHPQQTQASKKGRVGGNRTSKAAPVTQSLGAVGIYPRQSEHVAVLTSRRRILVTGHAGEEEHPHP